MNKTEEEKSKNRKQKKERKKHPLIKYILLGLVYLLGIIIIVLVYWSKKEYGFRFTEIVYTLTTPLAGADTSIVDGIKSQCIPKIIILFIPYLIWVLIDAVWGKKLILNRKSKKKPLHLGKLLGIFFTIACPLVFVVSLVYANIEYNVFYYIYSRLQTTEIYEEYYVFPEETAITIENEPKNLIFIYMESMETAYLSNSLGGNQGENLIPNLTDMANEHISFSNTEGVGGFHSIYGTTWTMGSLFATTTGVPFAFPVSDNAMGLYKDFASGITSLGDILQEYGYNQEFLCGSDASFAGRDTYFSQHGNYEIYDLYTARRNEYIPAGYYVNWGFEDKYLYEIAKDELLELASKDEPFNLTMLTVDTHFPGGYVCDKCPNKYETDAKKSIVCADTQVKEFVDWCTKQDFYEDTVIIIIGDHPRMDNQLVSNVKFYDRTMYNCIINADAEKDTLSMTNRIFTAMDVFPTTLAALGFNIEGDRLGLGTNLFSELPTLAEEIGYKALERELEKHSNYYVEQFK
ncbi:MAG: LTA synthase family protein [Lachnospiraceae bacterium]|nr:LTA synthase family protein [Lachnospiraceae bacterium]